MNKLIRSLIHEEGTIKGHEQFNSYIKKYYKGLFRDPGESNLSMAETWINDIPYGSHEGNSFLTASCNEEEVRKVVFEMEHNKAPVSDSFPTSSIKFLGDNKNTLDGAFMCSSCGRTLALTLGRSF
jgi:hypothetical protein